MYDSDYDESTPNIIIDNGTGYCKVGLSGEEYPRSVFPSCVGYPKYACQMVGGDKKEFFIGNDAIKKKGILKLNYPIEHGVVNNWDDMEKIWGHVFTNELRVAPEEHNVLLTEAPLNPKENREKMAQIMFETFDVPGLYIHIQAVLSLYSAGKVTGIVLDSGDGVTHLVPVFERYSLEHAIIRLDIAGRDLTEYFTRLLYEVGFRFSTTSEKEIVKKIKEESCYVALDFEEEAVEPYDYELPDGNHILIKDQRIKCPEALFNPSLMGKEGCGIAELCNLSIRKCDIDLRKELYYNILLSGGNASLKGLPERLEKELKKYTPGLNDIRVFPLKKKNFINLEKENDSEKETEIDSENDSGNKNEKAILNYDIKNAVWQGGEIASRLLDDHNGWITKQEYEESGATIVHRKCFQ